jgi:mono/diheme cytochrome c family protein
MMTPLEIKGLMAAVVTSAVVLIATFTAGGIYRNRFETETQPGTKSLAPENLAARGRSFFFQSCAHCHGRDADGGSMPRSS